MKFNDLPQDVQAAIQAMPKAHFEGLWIDAKRTADDAKIAELSCDPKAALTAVFRLRLDPITVKVDEPLAFVVAAIEVTQLAMAERFDDEPIFRALWEYLSAANSVLSDYQDREDRAREQLRGVRAALG